MGRTVKRPEDWVRYTPEAFGNRDDDDPLTCEIHWLSGSEYRRYRRMIVLKQVHGETKTNIEQINKKILTENVRDIRGYEMAGIAIRSGADLFDHGEPDLVDEILDAVTNVSRLEDGLGKQLTELSAGGAVGTLPSIGIAGTAKSAV